MASTARCGLPKIRSLVPGGDVPMRIVTLAAGLLAVVVLNVSAAKADFYTTGGHKVKLYFAASVNPDCTNAGTASVRVTQAPEHGRVNVQQTRDFTFFRDAN